MTTETRDRTEQYTWFRKRGSALRLGQMALLRRPLFLYLIVIPNVLSILYFGLIASPVYVSRVMLRVVNPASNGSSLTSMLSGGSGDGSSEGAFILRDYVRSWQAFQAINRRENLSHQYAKGDFVSAYGGLVTLFADNDVALWRYYRSHIDVSVDLKSGVASINLEAYRASFAQQLARAVLKDATDHLNQMNRLESSDLIAHANRRQQSLERLVSDDEATLARYRQKIGGYDPTTLNSSYLSQLDALAAKQAEFRSQYASIKAATPNSPDVRNIAIAMAALQTNIGAINQKIAALDKLSAAYNALAARRDGDVNQLQQASLAVLAAQQKAGQDQYYLSIVSQPSAPQTPELPHRLYWILGTAAVSLLLWGILR